MRSKQIVILLNDIANLDNHYSHFLFIAEQFTLDNRVKIKESPDVLTTTIFNENMFASQFNVPLGRLDGASLETRNFVIRSLFLLSYFQFEVYLRDIYYLAKSCMGVLPELNHRISILTQLKEHLDPAGSGFLTVRDMDTLDYLKLRRNSLVHRDVSRISQGELLDFIKANGKALNKYWSENELKIQSLDFTMKGIKLASFEIREVIDILNIIRRLSKKIDRGIMDMIGENNIRTTLLKEFWSQYKSTMNREQLKRKLRHFANLNYGIKYSETEIGEILGE